MPTLVAQRPTYKISSTLDTALHTLTGTISITYTNLSDQSLDSLAIHLWPNAYKEKNTAFGQQKLHLGDLTFHRAKQEDRGGLFDLDFSSTDQPITLLSDVEHIDIGWIRLSQPLTPGSTIHITSPYTLKIPVSFSRLGRTDNSYQLTQWYPHIAVYNEEGWHTMPYLDLGEYYNDFADYEVTIKTPSSYNVAATGSLISTIHESKYVERTYQASNVIDFAWFTSPTFRHETKSIDVGGNQKVILNMFIDSLLNDSWDTAIVYAERALKFYSDWLGPYPYPQMTVVYTPFSKAGYMEYPMVAQIGYTADPQFLDRVIAHEIGHTWLYGILANNERADPWLDEGFNSFLENEYMHTFYNPPTDYVYPRSIHSSHSMEHYDAMQHIVRSKGKLHPPLTSPVLQQNEQYIFSAYLLPAQGLRMMMSMVGRDTMQAMLKNYFNEHKFSHVNGDDVRSSFEKICQCNLSWFFTEYLQHAHEVDYRIKKFVPEREVTIINKATSAIPVLISEYLDNKKLSQYWIPGFTGEKLITLKNDADEIRIYDGLMAPNKQWWGNIKPRSIIPGINLIPKIGNYERPTLSVTPIIGYNITDGGMPGLAIITDLIPQPRFKFLLLPMYGIESKKFRYYGEGRFITDVDNNTFDKVLFGFAGSSFGYNLDAFYANRDYFQRLSPSIGLRMKASSPYSHVTKWWGYRYVDIKQFFIEGPVPEIFYERKRQYGVHELSFKMTSDTAIQPYAAIASVQAGKGFVRLNLHYDQHFRGKNQKHGLWIHGFLGWLPVYDNPDAAVSFTFNGGSSTGYFSTDYMYDEWLLGRNASSGNVSRQIFMKDAGLKTLSNVGITEKWMAGGGLSMALPVPVFHVYIDGAFYNSAITGKPILNYSAGLAIILIKNAFEIYIPILESKEIRESLTYVERDQWHERISFQANFKMTNPIKLLDHFQYKY